MIHAKIEYAPVLAALRRAASEMKDTGLLMASVAGAMHGATIRNFQEQGRPKWRDLASSTKLSKSVSWGRGGPGGIRMRSAGMILSNTGHLKNSVQMESTSNMAVVGTNVAYAAIHQFGGRTKPHVIRAKNARALSFGGIVVRQVNHPGSNIPARPFLRLTPRDLRDIVREAALFHQRALDRNRPAG